MARGKLCIGFAHPEDWNSWFGHSLIHTLNADWRGERRIKGRVIAVRSGPMIDKARNDICREFLKHEDNPDWLLMVDTDMVWQPQDLRRLFEAADENERPIIGGLCFAGAAGDMWPVMLVFDAEGNIRLVKQYPVNAPCKVDATGAAFLLIHRGVLEKMQANIGMEHPAPWFAFSYHGKIPYGEDVTFCLRAQSIGYPIYVHTGVKIGHMKTRPLNEAAYLQQLERMEKEEQK